MRASTICGSDLRAIYRPKAEERETGAEAYTGCVAGHEPCGIIIQRGHAVSEESVIQTINASLSENLADAQMNQVERRHASRYLSHSRMRRLPELPQGLVHLLHWMG